MSTSSDADASAKDLAHQIVNDLQGTTSKVVVSDLSTRDSMVEHSMDVDVVKDGWIYNVHVFVTRFGKDTQDESSTA